ncbi:MAG: Fertility inhibition FinO [Burkholderiaceae bacterium]|nr:Fertility inhibition FinO [Burkholderiaceae bacterium]
MPVHPMNDAVTENLNVPEGEAPAAAPAAMSPETVSAPGEPATPENPAATAQPGAATGRKPRDPAAASRNIEVLERLAALYPQLFGAVFRPLKRGIYQDLLAAQPDAFEPEALKAALGFHTRSTRYLSSVAAGMPRHDLAGQPVEEMAAEHVHQALVAVWRRRQGRKPADDLRARTVARMAQAFEASGISREDWRERLLSRDEAANALLDEALAQAAERAARDEALLRAFEASGQTVAAFAADYGLKAAEAEATLARAGSRRASAPAA